MRYFSQEFEVIRQREIHFIWVLCQFELLEEFAEAISDITCLDFGSEDHLVIVKSCLQCALQNAISIGTDWGSDLAMAEVLSSGAWSE